MKKIVYIFVLLTCLSDLSFSQINDTKPGKDAFTTPKEFMSLFYDFTGATNKDFPKGKMNASVALLEVLKQNLSSAVARGPLVLFINSSFYIYDMSGKKILSMALRASTHSGFYPMTAISHIGPALAYYAKVKERGGSKWRAGLNEMLKNIKSVRALNQQKHNNWLDKLDAKGWAPHTKAIHNMVDYACAMSGSYILSVLKGKDFTEASLNKDFLSGTTKAFPIPFNNIMVGTFMLTALESLTNIYNAVRPLKLDWHYARVIIRNVAGVNYTAAVSKRSNWLVPLVIGLSNGKLSPERVFIAPYAKVMPTTGDAQLSKAAQTYYERTVWGMVYNRIAIAKSVFKNIPNIKKAPTPPLPGDYKNTRSSDMEAFMKRLKYSLAEPTEMLSNTVGFWMVGEFSAKKGDVNKIEVPGLTVGFPKGIKAYPANSREIS